MAQIKWMVRKAPGGYEGVVVFPDKFGFKNAVTAQAHEKAKAVNRAAALAQRLATDPTVQAILPPGGAAALQAVSKIAQSKLARSGLRALRRLW